MVDRGHRRRAAGSPTSTSLDLSNLNRVAAGVADVGVTKVVLAARRGRRARPLHPRRSLFRDGVDEDDHRRLRRDGGARRDRRRVRRPGDQGARCASRRGRRGSPVVMATSHRGMLDVERFDLEPDRPAFHGLLGDVTSAELRRADDQAEGPVRAPHPRRRASLTDRVAPRCSRSRSRSRPGRSSPPTSRSAARWSPTPCAGSRSATFAASGRFYADLGRARDRRRPRRRR